MLPSRIRYTVAAALVAAAFALAPAAHAKVDYTDIWWAAGGTESGWGANFAQTGDFIFVTFFIYGPDGMPFWYTAQMGRTSGETFFGPVYAVTGTWFGAPIFPPVPQKNAVVVGDATFVASNSVRGTLRYRIDTVNVIKSIERQSTVGLSVEDTYIGGISGTVSGSCPAGTPGSFRNAMQIRVEQTVSNNVRIEFSGADTTNLGRFVCAMQGNAVQNGKVLYVSSASYQCATGLNTIAEIESIRQLDDGIEAHWRANLGGGCVERGRLAGVRQ